MAVARTYFRLNNSLFKKKKAIYKDKAKYSILKLIYLDFILYLKVVYSLTSYKFFRKI